MTKHEGIIIAVDGPDGSGKTTQLHMLKTWLTDRGHDVYSISASGGTAIGKALRTVSLSDIPRPPEVDVYISLAMHTAVGQDIQKHRDMGQIILVDRSPLAVIAYNMVASQLQDTQFGFDACERLLHLWGMDMLLIFEADQTVLNQRRASRTDKPADYFEKQPVDFFARVHAGYRQATEFTKTVPGIATQVVQINANHDTDTIQADVSEHVLRLLTQSGK